MCDVLNVCGSIAEASCWVCRHILMRCHVCGHWLPVCITSITFLPDVSVIRFENDSLLYLNIDSLSSIFLDEQTFLCSEWKLFPRAEWFHHLSVPCPVISLCNSDKCQTVGWEWPLNNCSRPSQFTFLLNAPHEPSITFWCYSGVLTFKAKVLHFLFLFWTFFFFFYYTHKLQCSLINTLAINGIEL